MRGGRGRSLKRLLGGAMGLAMGWVSAGAHGQELAPMAANAHPVFEVATVKASDPADQNGGFHLEGRRIFIECETVEKMVMFAYSVHPRQIESGPDWMGREKFDVEGVPDGAGFPDLEQIQGMVKKLLAERFVLRLQGETREMTVYALRVAKNGAKIAKSKGGPEAMDQTGNGNMMRFTANSMPDLAQGLQSMVDRPVLDQTGLAGRYDFALRWRPEGAPASDPEAAQPLFSAIPEQLGLKLEATRAKAPVLVVKHVDHPTAD